jgi:ubiquinone/menaquinone biosynthesis C-methylase UbiE
VEKRTVSIDKVREIKNYWERNNIGQAIIDLLIKEGKNLSRLTVEDLAQWDHFHAGGKAATVKLAKLANLKEGMRVLDVGGGLGGAARTLAADFGCQVTTIDLTESYVEASKMFTSMLGLNNQIKHYVGNALDLPFEDSSFDVVWTQNSGMNISNKEALYSGFYHVLQKEALLVFQEPMIGKVYPPIFPVMWATKPADSFLLIQSEMCKLIEETGFQMQCWNDITEKTSKPNSVNKNTIQYLIMGEQLKLILESNYHNSNEDRIVMVQAVFHKL